MSRSHAGGRENRSANLAASVARSILLERQGPPAIPKRSTLARVLAEVRRLGYVQVDSINVVERAHHLILGARLEGYQPEHITHHLESSRALFEHWTHDASIIPSEWLPHWKHRFKRDAQRIKENAWWQSRAGEDSDSILRSVFAVVKKRGPVRMRDCEELTRAASRAKGNPQAHKKGGWWEWHPEKAAIEHHWRSGRVAIAGRVGFEKVYDIAERVYGNASMAPASSRAEHRDWACREALARLGVATSREIAGFFRAIPREEVDEWICGAVKRGQAERVTIKPEREGKPVAGVALPQWETIARRGAEVVAALRDRITILCPFDPLLRDRQRLQRVFGVDFRFEAFTPAHKRAFGYYACALLEGDRIVGRIDPKYDRERGTLIVHGPWWEPSESAPSALRRRKLHDAVERLATQIGARNWELKSRT